MPNATQARRSARSVQSISPGQADGRSPDEGRAPEGSTTSRSAPGLSKHKRRTEARKVAVSLADLARRTRDHWVWTAFYEDGTSLAEYGPDGDHGFLDIDLQRIRAFELDPVDPASGRTAFCVLIDPAKAQRPIFFRRRASAWMLAGGEGETLLTCIGVHETVRGLNVARYVFFDDLGHVLITDNDNPLGQADA